MDDPVQLSVHELPHPAGLSEAERTRRGRWMMTIVVFLCALPVLASYFTFYVIKPHGRAYGDLIEPTHAMPADLAAQDLQGRPFDAQSLKGQWLLVVVDGGSCVGDCEKRLYVQQQLRTMLGKEMGRLDKVWLIGDAMPVAAELSSKLQQAEALHVLRVDPQALGRWLTPAAGQAQTAHLYLVDPMGRWMWRSPVHPEPAKVKKDLQQLMKAAAGWDREGR